MSNNSHVVSRVAFLTQFDLKLTYVFGITALILSPFLSLSLSLTCRPWSWASFPTRKCHARSVVIQCRMVQIRRCRQRHLKICMPGPFTGEYGNDAWACPWSIRCVVVAGAGAGAAPAWQFWRLIKPQQSGSSNAITLIGHAPIRTQWHDQLTATG